MCAFGLFNVFFRVADDLGLQRAFDVIQERYNYDENAPPPPRQDFGGMPRGFGRRAFGRRFY